MIPASAAPTGSLTRWPTLTNSLNIDSEKSRERTVRNPNRRRIDLPHRRRPAARVRRSAPAALPRPCPGRTGCGVGRCSAHEKGSTDEHPGIRDRADGGHAPQHAPARRRRLDQGLPGADGVGRPRPRQERHRRGGRRRSRLEDGLCRPRHPRSGRSGRHAVGHGRPHRAMPTGLAADRGQGDPVPRRAAAGRPRQPQHRCNADQGTSHRRAPAAAHLDGGLRRQLPTQSRRHDDDAEPRAEPSFASGHQCRCECLGEMGERPRHQSHADRLQSLSRTGVPPQVLGDGQRLPDATKLDRQPPGAAARPAGGSQTRMHRRNDRSRCRRGLRRVLRDLRQPAGRAMRSSRIPTTGSSRPTR